MIETKDNITNTKVLRPKTKASSIKTKTRELRLAKEILNNPSQSLHDSLILANYPESIAVNPNKVTNKPSFIEIMNKAGLTDERLSEVANEGLTANKPLIIRNKLTEYPDYTARHRYLETALKAKKHLQPDNNQFNTLINDYKVIIEE